REPSFSERLCQDAEDVSKPQARLGKQHDARRLNVRRARSLVKRGAERPSIRSLELQARDLHLPLPPRIPIVVFKNRYGTQILIGHYLLHKSAPSHHSKAEGQYVINNISPLVR